MHLALQARAAGAQGGRACSTASVSCLTAEMEAQPTTRGYASSTPASASAITALQAPGQACVTAASAAAAAALARRSCSGAQWYLRCSRDPGSGISAESSV